jgi:hypothetical protein
MLLVWENANSLIPLFSPVGATVRFDLAQNNCSVISPNPDDSGNSTSRPVERKLMVPASTPEINVTVGRNPGYPNPPGWGISYYLNGIESPHLILDDNATYTFIVSGGASHPLYITDSILGGKGRPSDVQDVRKEVVVAGDLGVAVGTPAQPGKLMFTTDMAAQSSLGQLYYQCYEHQKMGWKLSIAKKAASTPTPLITTTAMPSSAGRSTDLAWYALVGSLVFWIALFV